MDNVLFGWNKWSEQWKCKKSVRNLPEKFNDSNRTNFENLNKREEWEKKKNFLIKYFPIAKITGCETAVIL